jgi:CTP synthase
VITEIGGTVGDIESLPFLEAIRQFRKDVGRGNAIFLHVTLVPWIPSASEMKTKPTQHSVKELRSIGIQPDILVCRCDRPLPAVMKQKMSEFCDVAPECVVTSMDASSIYEVPLMLEAEGLAHQALTLLNLEDRTPDLSQWQLLVDRLKKPSRKVTIALVGKYIQLNDAYLSVLESLRHAATDQECELELRWVNAEDIETNGAESYLKDVAGVVVPGGFGIRGVGGKIEAIRYAREAKLPFLGLCLGMQCAVIEWATNVAKLPEADSSEFNADTPNPVIHLLPEQEDVVDLGGTMRLGIYACRVKRGSLAERLYGDEVIYERHRHRYEFNNQYRTPFTDSGYEISGTSPDGRLVEIIEYKDHPFFIACQFHPEFLSRPNRPHPLFRGLMEAAIVRLGPPVSPDPIEAEAAIEPTL